METTIDDRKDQKYCHSGTLKLFEKRKSRHVWVQYWAVLDIDSMRLFTNHESFLNDLENPKLIQLTRESLLQSVHKNSQSFQFKICNEGAMYSFKCDSESTRQDWLNNLWGALSGFCRKNCFHCSERRDDARVGITNTDNESVSSEDSINALSTIVAVSTNLHSGSGDQITKSPLKIYNKEENIFTSFNSTNKAKSESEVVLVKQIGQNRPQSESQLGRSMKNEKSPQITKNSFGYSFESSDQVSPSSLKLFDNQNKRFSTFSKNLSLKRERPMSEFANPGFLLDDEELECPEIPKRISKVYDAPLNYDVPALSKNDPSRGYLKVFTGKNNWKKYQAVIEKNVLVLSDPETPDQIVTTSIELKPNIKFTLLPRRNHDYRFKMTTGTVEYFLKSPNVLQRDSWIKALTQATSSVCQMACPRCCSIATRSAPHCTDTDSNRSSDIDSGESAVSAEQGEDTDDVFYVGMTNPVEGIMFMNSLPKENVYEVSGPEEKLVEPVQDDVESRSRSGYMKTNAIENNWEQYWANISGNKLLLHSSEDSLNTLKAIELSKNVQCKTAKRSSYDFRFTLVASAVESCEFKCASAHDRREWMTSLERAGRGFSQGMNAGSKISEIVTQIRENQSKLEELMEQKKLEEIQKKQQQNEYKQQQQKQQNTGGDQEIYDDISTSNIPQHQLPPVPQQVPPLTPPQKRQQQIIDNSEEMYDDIVPPPEQAPPPTPPQKRQQQEQQTQSEESQDIYELIPADNFPQQQLPPVPQQLPPPTPPQKRQQQMKPNSEDGNQDIYEIIPADNNQQRNPQKTEQANENEKKHEIIPADKVGQQPKQQQEKKNEIKNKEKGKMTETQKKLQKKEKKQRKSETSPKPLKEQETQEQYEKQKEKNFKDKVEDREEENILYEKSADNLEEQDQSRASSWNFEQHVQVLREALPRGSLTSSQDKEVELRMKAGESSNNDDDIKEKQSDVFCSENETVVTEIQDVEKFLTQVLGKLGNLPDDVNKERLELSQRLQKFLNLPNKETSKKKPPAPLPVEEKFDEVDEGEYGDVLSVSPLETHVEETYDDVATSNTGGEETYDDVVKEQPIDGEENYDDVVSVMKQTDNTPDADLGEELYDDINTTDIPTTPKNRSLSRVSNSSSDTLDPKNVAEAKKPSDITDKVFEGYLEKYRTRGLLKGFASKWQRRYCILTPLALYYYENQKDQKQKGQIILPSSDTVLRKGCSSFPEVKDGKLCFELGSNERSFLFKVTKESERTIWINHIEAALLTDLSDEQSKIMRQKSIKMSHHDDDDVEPEADVEDLYEAVDTFQKPPAPAIAEEKTVKETPSSSNDAPALPSRSKAPSAEPPAPVFPLEEEEFDEIDETEDYQLPDVTAPKPGSAGKPAKEEEKAPAVVKRQPPGPSGSPTSPPRHNSSQEAPHLPPRGASKPAPGPPTPKKTPPELPTRTTPTLARKNLTEEPSLPQEEPIPEVQTQSKPEVTPPINAKPKGERFDYAKVYVAMWNCDADDEDDLPFSRGNYLYIREKIPNSDWWVASLMDIPDIRVGLVPRNYIMPAYVM